MSNRKSQDFVGLVHDNEIISYEVNFEKRTLFLHTKYYEKEFTDIMFENVLAHCFENEIQTNILFGMYQMPIEDYIKEYAEIIEKQMPYGFPISSNNLNDLKAYLINNNYNIYQFDSSLGMCGYVIAKNVDLVVIENIKK